MEKERFESVGRYEVRFWNEDGMYESVKTDNWLVFMRLRLTKDVIYYKVTSK